ncbi:MAG: hypothetical protein AAF321_03720 [Pseudomonadota bacterium]
MAFATQVDQGLWHGLKRGLRRLARVVGLAGLAIGVGAAAAEAGVKASYENGYARIVIRDANISPPRTELNDGLVFIDLEKPIDVDLSDVPASIPRAVSAARLDPDGRGIRLALTRDFRINTVRAGDELYIDVLPTNWTGPMPALPPEAIKRLSDLADAVLVRRDGALPEVTFRYGIHPTFARLAFLWEGAVSAEMTRDDDQIEVVFSAGGTVDLTALKQRMPEELQQVRAGQRDGKLVVQIDVLPSVPVRGFWDEGAYVVDVTTAPSSTLDQLNIAPRAALPTSEPAPDRTSAVARSAPPPPPGLAGPAPRTVREVRLAPRTPPSDELDIIVTPPGEDLALTFAFEAPTPAAVFDRGDDVWAVFGSERAIDVNALREVVLGRVGGLDLARIGDVQVLRFSRPEGRVVALTADGAEWTLSLADSASEVSRTIAPLRTREASEAGLVDFPVEGPLITRDLDLPGLGRVSLALASEGPQGMPTGQTYVEFDALRSAQGLAVLPKVDGLRLVKTDEGVRATLEGGLQLTQARRAFDLLADDRLRGAPTPRVLFADSTAVAATDRAGELMRRAAAMERPARRSEMRMQLAEHYVSHLFAPEALSVLSAIEQDDDALADTTRFLLLKGVANTLLGRTPYARAALNSPELIDDPEARLWLSLADVQDGHWAKADRAFRDGAAILHAYPPSLQARFRLAAARAALERNDVSTAGEQLERLVVAELDRGQLNERALLIGRFSQIVGRAKDAEKAYEVVEAQGERPRSYEAQVRLTDLRVANGDLSLEDGIQRLRALAMGWRGDSTEIHALNRLSALELEAGNHREAFEALRQAVLSRPDLDEVTQIQDAMSEAFAQLFLEGEADTMPAVEALSLYYDFNDLTPVGSRGDEMIRRLADRLIAVDLLPKAAELLQYQIDNRLRGAARAQVAAKLALVQLMDNRPSAALSTLSRTRQASLPGLIDEDRRLLEAQALMKTGRVDFALETLSVVDGPRADRLRANALWEAERWGEAGEEMERIIGRAWESTPPLTETQRRYALRAAIAYTLAGDAVGLERLRGNLLGKMEGTPDEAAFAVVSQPVGDSSVAFAGVAGQLSRADDLDAFLDEYRARYFGTPEDEAPAAPEVGTRSPGPLETLDVALNDG